MTDRKGEKNPNSKLTIEQVNRIREMNKTGLGEDRLFKIFGKSFGISKSAIGKIIRGETWSDSNGEQEKI